MSSHKKNNPKRVNDIQDIHLDDGSEKTITYQRSKVKASANSLTKGNKILITIAVVVVAAGIVTGVYILIKKKFTGGQSN